MGDPLVVPCCEPGDDCEGPGYTPCARFKQDAKCSHTNQMDMDEFICMVIRRDVEIENLKARVAELESERVKDSISRTYARQELVEMTNAAKDIQAELEDERANYWPVEKAVAPWMLKNADLLERAEKAEDGIDAAIRLLTGAQGKGYQVKILLETIRHGKH